MRCFSNFGALKSSDDKKIKKYMKKKWTSDEVVKTFKTYLKNNGYKYKSIAGFIICDFCKSGSYSPLVKTHMTPDTQEPNFNGTAKKIQDFVIKKTGKSKEFSPGLYIKTGRFIDDIQEEYIGNPNLLYPETELSYHFFQYLNKKIDNSTFKIPFMCSEHFMLQFVDEASKNHQIIKRSNLRRN